MLPRLKNTTFYPSWVDDFFPSAPLPNVESRVDATMPAVNVKEDENQFNIEVAAPGMEKKNFRIDLNHNVLTISAEKEEKKEDKNEKITRQEFNYTSFQRSFTLPNSVKDEGIKASYKEGILIVTIPKKEEAKAKAPKQIEIS
jgi:HSP20 family protein